jgi:hypothetical protein
MPSESRLPSSTPYGTVTVTAFPPGQSSPWLAYRLLRKAVIFCVGVSVVLVGVVMVVTPGPALVVIPLGLAILATEFAWAKRLLDQARAQTMDAIRTVRGSAAPGPKATGADRTELPEEGESRRG